MCLKFHQVEVASSKINLLEFDKNFNHESYLDSLSEIEIERFFEFKHEKRKKEFVATRFLKHQLFGYQEIKYSPHGAPYFDISNFISISHATHLVGIASNENFQIGFDIEKISSKTKTIFPKYLNDFEQSIIDVSDEVDLTIAWSLKESLYKLAGRKLIDFKKDLLLLEKNNDLIRAKICNPNEEIFVELSYIQFGDYMITCNSKEIEYVQK